MMLTAMILATASPAPASGGDQRFLYSAAVRGCTQEDAPALELYFTVAPFDGAGEPTAPYLRVEVAAAPTEVLSGATLNLIPSLRRGAGQSGRIARAELVAVAHTETWLSGTVVLDQAKPGQDVAGHYDLTAPDGRRLTHAFHALWNPRPTVCG